MAYTNKHVLFNNNLKQVVNDFISQVNSNNGTGLLSSPALTYGSSAPAKVKNSDFTVVRNGIVSKIDTAETALKAGIDNIADGSGAVFLVYLDAENAIKIEKGTDTTGGVNAICPATPEGGFKVGEFKVVMSGGAFTAGTTSLNNGTGLTATFANKTDVVDLLSTYQSKHWLHQENLYDVYEAMFAGIEVEDGVRFLSSPNLAIGTSSNKKIKYGAFAYLQNGSLESVSGGEVAFTATEDDITADATKKQEAQYLVYLDDATVKILKGETTDEGKAVLPATPAGKIKMGSALISVSAGATDFDASSDNLDAVHLTITYTSSSEFAGEEISFSLEQKNYLYHKNLLNLFNYLIAGYNKRVSNILLSNPSLAKGSNGARVAHGALLANRNGVMVTISASSTGIALTATTHNLADTMGAIYSMYLDASNTETIVMGVPTLGGEGAVAPAIPEAGLKIGEFKIVNTSGANFVADTTALDAGGIETTYTNNISELDLVE